MYSTFCNKLHFTYWSVIHSTTYNRQHYTVLHCTALHYTTLFKVQSTVLCRYTAVCSEVPMVYTVQCDAYSVICTVCMVICVQCAVYGVLAMVCCILFAVGYVLCICLLCTLTRVLCSFELCCEPSQYKPQSSVAGMMLNYNIQT